jgi:hypothetical protein
LRVVAERNFSITFAEEGGVSWQVLLSLFLAYLTMYCYVAVSYMSDGYMQKNFKWRILQGL